MKTHHLHHLHFCARPAPPPVFHRTCILLTAMLAGCVGAPPVAVEVRVPVLVPCVTAVPVRTAYEFGKLKMAASDGKKVIALARDWSRAMKYEGELEAAIEGCRCGL